MATKIFISFRFSDGKEIKSFNSLGVEILFADKVNVLRGGKEIVLDINKEGVGEVLKTGAGGYLSVRTPIIVDSVLEGKPAKLAGLEKGDKIVGINGQPTLFFDEVTKALELNKNQKVSVEFIRNNDHKNVEVVTDEHGKLGFIPDITPMKNILEQAKVTQEIGFFASIPRGFERTIESLTQQVKQFKILFNKPILICWLPVSITTTNTSLLSLGNISSHLIHLLSCKADNGG